MNCSDCRIQEQGDCATPGTPCWRFKPPRGKLRDWLCDTGMTEKQFLNSDTTVAPNALKGKSRGLPAPYNRSTPGEKERAIQKEAMKLCADIFPFVSRIEGAGKIVTVGDEGRFINSEQKGLPDAIACKGGIMYGIEFKRSGGHLSPEQYAKLKSLHDAGAKVCICVSPEKIREWVDIGTYTCRLENWLDVL